MPIRLGRFLWGLLSIIIILPLAGMLYQAIATWIDKRNYPPRGDLVDVGGYSLYLHCIGDNTDRRPTVVLETGLGGGVTSADWAYVQPEIGKTTRVCAYDRAGLGWSDLSPQPRDAQHIATELHTLLQNSHTPPPYVLVGWSYGGLYVRAYADQYPEEVAGMVLLDSSSPDQCTSTPAWRAECASGARTYYIAPILARLGVMRGINLFQPASGLPSPQSEKRLASLSSTKDWDALKAEFLASAATTEQVLNSRSLGSIPLAVVTATDHGAPPDLEQLWQVWQTGFTTLSTNSAQRVVQGATHESLVLSSTGSKASIEAILQVVEAARTGEKLKP
jgi:pimeloyl-ACP methyl ester carboxylesterase